MTDNLNLLLVEDVRDTLKVAKTAFASKGFNVDTCQKDGKAVLKCFREKKYDALILDAVMSNYDAVAVIKTITMDKTHKKPAIIVTSNYDNGIMQREVIQAGADYFVLKPFDFETMCERLEMLVNNSGNLAKKSERISLSEIDLEVIVTDMLHQIGVPAHIKGYQYLRTSIVLAIKDREIINHITKELYPTVAKHYKTTSTRVERAIRHAIEVAWDRGDVDVLNSYFGYTIQNQKGKPTNSEFVAMLADKISLKIKAS